MPVSTSVKRIESTMRGAPTLNGTAGTLIAVIDALRTGFGPTTAISVTVAGGIATASLTPGETFDRDAVISVSGATPGALNGEARVLTSGNTAITWATTAADGAASGTIVIKYAPALNWDKVYAATNKAAYRSNHAQASGHYLRIDDTGTTSARLRGYESMTDVDTGTGPFPTDAQLSGGGYLWKSLAANATAVKYRVFCDERFIIFAIAPGIATNAVNKTASARGFGDTLALAPSGDVWSTVLSVSGSSNGSSYNGAIDGGVASSTSGMCAAPRAISGLGSAVVLDPVSFSGAINLVSGADNFLGAVPSDVDGRLRPSRLFVKEQAAGKPPRATLPGTHYLPHSGVSALINDGDVLDGSGELAGRRLLCVGAGSTYSGANTGIYLVDLTGPWR